MKTLIDILGAITFAFLVVLGILIAVGCFKILVALIKGGLAVGGALLAILFWIAVAVAAVLLPVWLLLIWLF